MPETAVVADTNPISLGQFARCMRHALPASDSWHVTVRFEQQLVLVPLGGRDPRPPVRNDREVVADITVAQERIVAGEIEAGDKESEHRLRVWFASPQEERYLYSIDGHKYGRLQKPAKLFSLRDFERRLDDVEVRDATVDDVSQPGVFLLKVEVVAGEFRKLLALFADEESIDADLLLEAYELELRLGQNLHLQYSWSLAGDERDQYNRDCRAEIDCSVDLHIETTSETRQKIKESGSVPALENVDAVWGMAREAAQGKKPAAKRLWGRG